MTNQDNGQTKRKKLWGIVAMLAVFIATPILLLMLVWKDRCVHTTKNSLLSPSGILQAVVIETDCGLAMSKATQLRIDEKRGNRWSNVGDVIVLQGVHPVMIEWLDTDLQVGVPEGAVIVKSREQVGDTKVVYIGR